MAAPSRPVAPPGFRLLYDLPRDGGQSDLVPVVAPVLHVLTPFTRGDRTFVRCDCGLILETFNIERKACPIGEAQMDYLLAIQVAERRRDTEIAEWRRISELAARELQRGAA